MLKVGIIGLPNVGKSTLFNALLKKQQALAANYPFATIEPNVGVVPVPDARLDKLAEIVADERNPHPGLLPLKGEGKKESSLFLSKGEGRGEGFPPIVPATVEFVDIAGLVKGASEGAGLGNKFLSHIREVQVIAHVVRAFADQEVIREGSVDPTSDYKTIQTELILADLQTLSKVNEKTLKLEPHKKSAVEKLNKSLDEGIPAHQVSLTMEEQDASRDLQLLSSKPEIVVLNVSENDYSRENIPTIISKYSDMLSLSPDNFSVICAKIESDLSVLSEEEQREYLLSMGLSESGLERLIKTAYTKLGLISFLTAGEKEVRAWTVKKGAVAPEAAGVIHTDFIKNFIKAEVVSFDDFVKLEGWKGAREKGQARMEGRDYIMQEGDVVEFKIGR